MRADRRNLKVGLGAAAVLGVAGVGSAAALAAGGATGIMTGSPTSNTISNVTLGQSSPAQAEAAAITYVKVHNAGAGQTRVLKVEADTESGVPVYDIRILAPNGTLYVVHVQRSNDSVLAESVAETQSSKLAPKPSSATDVKMTDTHSTVDNSPDKSPASPDHSKGSEDQTKSSGDH